MMLMGMGKSSKYDLNFMYCKKKILWYSMEIIISGFDIGVNW